jgi:hypothetical protein
MTLQLSLCRVDTLPPLAWFMTWDRGSRAPTICAGAAVEALNGGIVAGAWSGAFTLGGMADAVASCGSGVQTDGNSLIVVCGTAGADVVFSHRLSNRLTISNSLALVLAATGDAPRRNYPFYSNDLFSIYFGTRQHRAALPMERGTVCAHFGSLEISPDLKIGKRPLPRAPRFADFGDYRAFLVEQTAAMFANSSHPARLVRYQPIASLSAGYDAPAAAVVAREAGCADAFTFRQSVVSDGEHDDSGEAIARALGLSIVAFDTFGYHVRSDFPEIPFASAGFGGARVHHAGHEDTLRKRIVIGGGGGDRIWNFSFQISAHELPMYLGGYSETKFFLDLPALMMAIPAIGMTSFEDIGRISRSEEMRPWSVGGSYDRPIARRLIEEAGVRRGDFALGKLRIALGYEFPLRKVPALHRYLSPPSLADFERWFSRERPITRLRIRLHNLAEATLGRLIWSKKLIRRLRTFGIRWPPAARRLGHLRVPIRKNAFVFQWAMEQEIARHRKALAAAAPDDGREASRSRSGTLRNP